MFVTGVTEPVEVARKPKAPIVPPLDGEPALIDPRTEDATKLMILDLRETYLFNPLAAKGTRDHARAIYTIKTLRLNIRDELTQARREAYGDYVGRVHHYKHERDAQASSTRLVQLREAIQQHRHPTVWREMLRQREKLPKLQELFAAVPEAADW